MDAQFHSLITSIDNDLRAWSYYLTKNKEDANDLYQDCMVKLYTNASKFQKDSNIKAWSLTIMRNLFLNDIKKKKKMPKSDIDEYGYLIDSKSPSAVDQISYKEILSEIKKLPQTLATTFNMFTNGFKYHEIAEELQIPIGTVKSRINTTRKMLQASLN